ncbi:MAG: hypothetical protein ACKVON_06515 [Beijerinckiaceae bacterium]
MSRSSKYTFRTQHDNQMSALARMLGDGTQSGSSACYLLTLTFDRYYDRYMISAPSERAVTRADVLGGLTCKMPPAAAVDLRLALIRRFYVRFCRKLLGRDWARLRNVQPRGIGWLDAPVAKTARKLSPLARLPGDVFDHAHIVLAIPTLVLPGRNSSVQERFEELSALGQIQHIWRGLQNEGEAHIVPAPIIHGALHYSAKTAKRLHAFHDHMIILPD